jgi:hypothetical protein
MARRRRRGLAREQSRTSAGWRHGSPRRSSRPAGATWRSSRGGATRNSAGRPSSRCARRSGTAARRSGTSSGNSRRSGATTRGSGAATRIAARSRRSARLTGPQPPRGAARSGRWEPACAWSRHSTRHSATRQAGDRSTAAAPECATGADCASRTDCATGADCAARPRTKASGRASGSAADGRWPSRRGRGRPRGRQASLRDASFASNRSGDLPASPAVTVT